MNLTPLLNGLIKSLRRLPSENELLLLASRAHDAQEEIQQTRLIVEGTGREKIESALLHAEAAFMTIARRR